MKKIFYLLLMLIFSVSSCKNTNLRKKSNLNKTEQGAVVGTSTGAVLGGIIGNKKNNTVLGAILGATVGGAVGVIIGNKMDKQAKKIQDELGDIAKVERIGEGIKLTFDSQLLFDFGKFTLKDQNKIDLKELATTLNQYPDTEVLIVGHTDSVGSVLFNQKLSKKRANAVSSILMYNGISKDRLKIKGLGESQPTETNETDFGRSQNRRVELAIYANNKMKTDANREIN
jgi:outer membrane protein OmpA-like peptidoglycan-associated protein